MENPQNDEFIFKNQGANVRQNLFDFSNKNTIIIVLLFLLIISFLGINLLSIGGDVMNRINNIFGPLIVNILSFFGYTTGTVINKTADVVGDTAKLGVDIAQGTVTDVGNLLKDASRGVDPNARNVLDSSLKMNPIDLNQPRKPPVEPVPAPAENPIQKPISSSKTSWCLVGEYKEKRGCIELDEHDKCLSGQVYPNQKMCLNPTLTPNV